MSRSWSTGEDRSLVRMVLLCKKAGMGKIPTFQQTARKLNRSPEECWERWNQLVRTRRDPDSAVYHTRQNPAKRDSDSKRLFERVEQLEEKQRLLYGELGRLREENRLLRRDVKFMETLLLEAYQLLVQLLGKKSPNTRIHKIIS